MNLKEAFRFQNRLGQLLEEAEAILSNDKNITQTENTYFLKKAWAEAENEVVAEAPLTEYSEYITELAGFLIYILEEKEKLSAAIRAAKSTARVDIDSEVGLNSCRQQAAGIFKRMADLRASELLLPGGGTGYRFNAEGNQVPYRCDVKQVTTINFDRKVIRRYLAELNRKADAVSTEVDRCLVDVEVSYERPFDVNDSFAAVFEDYLDKLTKQGVCP